MWSEPAVVKHFGGEARPPDDVWMRLLRYGGLWALLGYGYWTIRETATGRFVGELGFADFHRVLSPGFDGAPEVGWTLSGWAQGRGMASEAVTAVLGWADAQGWKRTACMIVPANTTSLRLAGRHGYTPYAETDFKGKPVILLERLAS